MNMAIVQTGINDPTVRNRIPRAAAVPGDGTHYATGADCSASGAKRRCDQPNARHSCMRCALPVARCQGSWLCAEELAVRFCSVRGELHHPVVAHAER